MPREAATKLTALLAAVLGWGAFLVRSMDEGQDLGEIGIFAIAVGMTGTICFALLTTLPGVALAYAIGWRDRDRMDEASHDADALP